MKNFVWYMEWPAERNGLIRDSYNVRVAVTVKETHCYGMKILLWRINLFKGVIELKAEGRIGKIREIKAEKYDYWCNIVK